MLPGQRLLQSQVLEFVDEETLTAARTYLEDHHSELLLPRAGDTYAELNDALADLILITRDFLMKRFPLSESQIDDAIDAALNSSIDLIMGQMPLDGPGDSTNGTGATNTSGLATLLGDIFGGQDASDKSSRRKLMADYTRSVSPYVGNDPLLRSHEQWFHSRTQANMAWLVGLTLQAMR
eukprot:353830-Chlamydomonas_euryale.AAC.13